MGVRKEQQTGVSVKRPSSRRKVFFSPVRQLFAVDQIHDKGINLKDFSIYLAGVEKWYQGDDRDFSEPGIEYQISNRFIKNLHILSARNPRHPILVHMKTCGGYWEEGMAIYDALLACPNPVTILSYTHARSMSSIILQAADKRVLMPHSYFLFHEGTLELAGTNKGVLSNAKWIEKVVNPTMMEIYVRALKRRGRYQKWSEDKIRKHLQEHMDKKEDVFLTPKQAVEWGFADEVFGESGHFNWPALRKYSDVKTKKDPD